METHLSISLASIRPSFFASKNFTRGRSRSLRLLFRIFYCLSQSLNFGLNRFLRSTLPTYLPMTGQNHSDWIFKTNSQWALQFCLEMAFSSFYFVRTTRYVGRSYALPFPASFSLFSSIQNFNKVDRIKSCLEMAYSSLYFVRTTQYLGSSYALFFLKKIGYSRPLFPYFRLFKISIKLTA